MSSTIWSMNAVACGISVGSRQPSLLHRLPPLGLVLLRRPPPRWRCSSFALVMILSSMSVTFETWSTTMPRVLEETAQHVIDERETAVTDVRRPVDGRTADVEARPARLAGLQLLATTRGRVMKAQHRSTVLGLCRLPACPIDPRSKGSRIAGPRAGSRTGTYRFDREPRPRGGVLDRHAASDGVRLAARRPRVLLHPDRHRRPLPAHDGQDGLLPDRLGRQRAAHRTPGTGLLRRQLRPVAALRPGLRPAGPRGQRDKNARAVPVSRPNFVELCLLLIAEDEQAFEQLFRKLGASVDWTQHYTTISEASRRASQRGFLRLLARGEAYRHEAPTLWDVDFQHRGRPGRARRQGGPGLLPPAPLRREHRRRRARRRDRDDPARARARLRRPRRAPGRRALPVPVRHRGADARCSRSASRSLAHELAEPEKGSGIAMICTFGDLTDVTWWRELALPTRSVVGQGRPARAGAVRNARLGVGRPRAGERSLRRARGPDRQAGPGADRRAAARLRATSSASRGPSPTPSSTTSGASGRSRSSPPGSGTCARCERREALLATGRELNWHPEYMRARYEAWVEGLTGDWNISRQRFFGVPFPVWYRLDDEGEVVADGLLLASEDRLPGRPVDRRARGLHRGPAGQARRLRRRPGRDGHLGDLVAHAADRRQVGGGPGAVRQGLPDGPATAGARDHPDLALLDGRALRARALRAALAPRRHLGMDPRPGPQEDRQVGRQRRHAARVPREVQHRRRALLGRVGTPRRRHASSAKSR